MSVHKKRQADVDGLAPEFPENPSHREEAQVQNPPKAVRESLALFPPSAWKSSADWHFDRANRARTIPALKHHLRMWAIRWACYLRSMHNGFAEYAPDLFRSAIITSGLRVRFRVNDIQRLCREINRTVWGED